MITYNWGEYHNLQGYFECEHCSVSSGGESGTLDRKNMNIMNIYKMSSLKMKTLIQHRTKDGIVGKIS